MRIRLTIRGLMTFMAMFGVGLAAFRAHISLGSFVVGVLSLATIRTNRIINLRRAEGLPTPQSEVIWTFFVSSQIASTIIVIAFLPAIPLIQFLPPQHGCFQYPAEVQLLATGLLVSLTVGITTVLRRQLW